MLEQALSGEGYRVVTAADGAEGIERLSQPAAGGIDLVLSDLKLPGADGLAVLDAALALPDEARPPVILMTGYGTVPTAVDAMRRGAFTFVEKPVELDDLFRLVAEALGSADEPGSEPAAVEVEAPAEVPAFRPPGCPPIVGRHPKLAAAFRLLEKVATTESTVLLTGESGTGKELFARALHGLSHRSAGPFVAINCAAIPEALVENELFGHERGAFTGADRRQAGRFERARRGTLFLDEVGELPLAVQGKVLRVLEERTYERVGGGGTQTADVRLVTATNRDLGAMVAVGTFRQDLYFRLDVFPIALPPLAERASDVPHLARHLVAAIAERHGMPAPRLTADALELLTEHPWPGNVRELGNVLERSVILAEGGVIRRADVAAVVAPLEGESDGERTDLEAALRQSDGDKRRAAEILGVSYRTVLRRVQRYDLEGFPKYR
jgi:DNA-binding NtrC family response regulator